MTWRARSKPGALGVLVTLGLALLLAAGQAPYDWAWSRGHHATPAQWRAHERYGQRGGAGHHGAAVRGAEGPDAAAQAGTWLDEGGHEAHAPAPDGVQASTETFRELRPSPSRQRVSLRPITLPRGPTLAPPLQPPRAIS